MPRNAEWAVDGVTVRGELHEPENGAPRGVLVKLHGLASERREFGDVPARLAERGWAVLAFDRRGHGRSDGERGHVSAAGTVAELRGAIAWLAEEDATREAPLGLVGHSMGGAFATLALGQMPEFRAAVLVAPMARTRDELSAIEYRGYLAAERVSRFKEKLGLGALVVPYKSSYPDLFFDESAAREAEKLAFLQDKISLVNVPELLAVDAPQWARNVKQPTLVVLGRHDKVVQNRSSLRVFESLTGPKELVTLECGHSMFMDCRRDELVEHVDRWMGAHLG